VLDLVLEEADLKNGYAESAEKPFCIGAQARPRSAALAILMACDIGTTIRVSLRSRLTTSMSALASYWRERRPPRGFFELASNLLLGAMVTPP
jgi:hypothetical protein